MVATSGSLVMNASCSGDDHLLAVICSVCRVQGDVWNAGRNAMGVVFLDYDR